MSDAFTKGLNFLLSRQHSHGFWTDWNLPVGSSSMWTTAYVGWRLSSCRAPFLQRAADWLLSCELAGGGWGYAESVGADADSTALGILFLHAMGRRVTATAESRLRSFQRSDGGFATYGFDQSFGAWTASQPEITATAALALRALGAAPAEVERASDFLRRRRQDNGLWNSYWWTSPCYATEAAVRLLGEDARQKASRTLQDLPAPTCFERALRSMILASDLADLESAQEPDGSWPSAPVLRLTSRDRYKPEEGDDSGPCFADQNRVFTTATVLHAISRYNT